MAKVLIIEGNGYLARLLLEHLAIQGHEMIVARKGADGMKKALDEHPDVIMMDSLLPDQTGFQMCNQFRRTAQTQGIPIIMVSDLAQFPNQQQYAMERGANEYVPKPSHVIELGDLVDKYIQLQTHLPNTFNRKALREGEPPAFDLSQKIHNALNPRIEIILDREKPAKNGSSAA